MKNYIDVEQIKEDFASMTKEEQEKFVYKVTGKLFMNTIENNSTPKQGLEMSNLTAIMAVIGEVGLKE